jgi:hypothetical protein
VFSCDPERHRPDFATLGTNDDVTPLLVEAHDIVARRRDRSASAD